MTRPPTTLRSAHLLMWSSPLLLVVLAFTLTTGTSRPTSQTPAQHHHSTSETTTTLEATSPTTSTTVLTTTRRRHTGRPTTSVTRYVDATSPKAAPTAIKPVVVVSSGVLSGALSPGFRVADVPLQGPGLWVLDTSTVIQAHLQCASRSVVVNSRVVIMTAQNCQLQLISTNREVTPTWQLTPVR